MSFETRIVCYAAPVTEYEFGWGARHDGYIIAKTREAVQAKGLHMTEIAQNAQYGYEYIGDIFAFEPTQHAIDKLTDQDYIWIGNNFGEWGTKI